MALAFEVMEKTLVNWNTSNHLYTVLITYRLLSVLNGLDKVFGFDQFEEQNSIY